MAHMRDDYGGAAGIALFVILVFAAIAALCFAASNWLAEHGPGDAIQGLYSHLNCDTQPGAHPWYVEVDNQRYFMGCRNPGDPQ